MSWRGITSPGTYISPAETGLYYLGSRYYDPVVKRFISADTTDVLTTLMTALTDKNLYAYCDDNPVVRIDVGGAFWETVFDIVSLATSIMEVVTNPQDPWAWVGLAGDTIDLIPVVTGVGESVRGMKTVAKVDKAIGITSNSQKGWKLGDEITTLTKAGNVPSWNTVKSRYWKNDAYYNAEKYTKNNLVRMQKGRAPLVKYSNGKYYSMELHHIIPRHSGGLNNYDNLLAVTPWDHARIDPYRYFKP